VPFSDPSQRYPDAESLAVGLASAAAGIWGPGWMTDTDMAISASGAVLNAATGRATMGAPETIGPLPREVPTAQPGGTGELVPVNLLEPNLGGAAAAGLAAAGPATIGPGDTVPTPETLAAGGHSTMDAPAPTPPTVPAPPARGSSGGGGRRVALIAGALVVLAAVIGVVLATSSGSKKQAPLVAPVTVDGKAAWTDTGVVLKKGDDVTVTATGAVNPAVADMSLVAPPDGVPGRTDLHAFNVVAGANHSGLIGRIGSAGPPFVVGSRKVFKADAAGTLFLGINDTGVENNAGKFQANVVVARK
jgi:hypothetical protein